MRSTWQGHPSMNLAPVLTAHGPMRPFIKAVEQVGRGSRREAQACFGLFASRMLEDVTREAVTECRCRAVCVVWQALAFSRCRKTDRWLEPGGASCSRCRERVSGFAGFAPCGSGLVVHLSQSHILLAARHIVYASVPLPPALRIAMHELEWRSALLRGTLWINAGHPWQCNTAEKSSDSIRDTCDNPAARDFLLILRGCSHPAGTQPTGLCEQPAMLMAVPTSADLVKACWVMLFLPEPHERT